MKIKFKHPDGQTSVIHVEENKRSVVLQLILNNNCRNISCKDCPFDKSISCRLGIEFDIKSMKILEIV